MILAIDTENSTSNKGNWADVTNQNVCISYWTTEGGEVLFGERRKEIVPLLRKAKLVVGFNLKYDLHWLRRLGFYVPGMIERVWDVQVVEFLLNLEHHPYPDLDSTALKYLGRGKSKVVEEEYWAKDIDTPQIPPDVLTEYALLDSELTFNCYLAQRPYFNQAISLSNQDLIVLEEIEWNGLKLDEELAEQKAKDLEDKITEIKSRLSIEHNVPGFNWNSTHHLSALLFGGTIETEERVPNGVFKTGQNTGKPRFRVERKSYKLPRRYTPNKKSKLQVQNKDVWSVDEKYLLLLDGPKELIQGILEIKGMEKLIGTYYRGFPHKRREMNWPKGKIHSNFSQVTVVTKRLASNSPNVQNIPNVVQDIMVSRFD